MLLRAKVVPSCRLYYANTEPAISYTPCKFDGPTCLARDTTVSFEIDLEAGSVSDL